MATGDVTCEIVSIAAGANRDIQPSAGVVYIVVESGSPTGSISNNLYDGANTFTYGASLLGRINRVYGGVKMAIDNSAYLRQSNGAGAAIDAVLSYYEYV